MTTFNFIAASHDWDIRFENERTMVVTFNDINLPDSTANLQRSQGFFKYSLAPIEEVAFDEKIYSHADIFFDYNAPIRTNDGLAWIGRTSSVKDTETPASPYQLFPNPASDELLVDGLGAGDIEGYSIYNISGQKLVEGRISITDNKVDISGLVPGIHLIQLNGKSKTVMLKFIKSE